MDPCEVEAAINRWFSSMNEFQMDPCEVEAR